MPRGTPFSLKCPRCRRGKYGQSLAFRGCHSTGVFEERLHRSRSSAGGGGGHRFYGYRGQVKCDDCGHTWFSSHPRSGRKAHEPWLIEKDGK